MINVVNVFINFDIWIFFNILLFWNIWIIFISISIDSNIYYIVYRVIYFFEILIF